MQTEWAAENLEIIRTLMERAAVYRRALAPVMTAVGLTGIAAGIGGMLLRFGSAQTLVAYWMSVAGLCLLESFLMIRRQALKDGEAVWSPPTRRVTLAVMPAFFTGFMVGLPFLMMPGVGKTVWLLVPSWMVIYGLALHAAGFFIPRGFRLFGWGFVLGGFIFLGCVIFVLSSPTAKYPPPLSLANWAMAGVFGGAHLAYGLYLRITEKRPEPV